MVRGKQRADITTISFRTRCLLGNVFFMKGFSFSVFGGLIFDPCGSLHKMRVIAHIVYSRGGLSWPGP